MARRLKNLRIDEVSSVDRGAGEGVHVLLAKRHTPTSFTELYTSTDQGDLPNATAAYLKREFSAEERRDRAASGHAMPDGSFPIDNKSDLANAIHAIGRAKNPGKAKAHIKTRARALGATDMLPDEWSKRDASAELALRKVLQSMGGEVDEVDDLVTVFKQFHAFLDGDQPQEDDAMTISIDKNDLTKLIGDLIAKAFADAGVPVKKMTPEHEAYHQNLDGDEAKKFGSMGHDEREKYMKEHPHGDGVDGEHGDGEGGDGEEEAEKLGKQIAKALQKGDMKALSELMTKAAKKKKNKTHNPADDGEEGDDHGEELDKRLKPVVVENTQLKKRLAVLEEKDQAATFAKRAVEIGLTENDGTMLLKAHRGDPEALKEMETRISALTKQIEKSGLFSEFGSRSNATGTSAHDQLVAKAAEIRKSSDKPLTVDQAYVKALEIYPDLAKQEKAERDARVNKLAIGAAG